MLRQRYNLGPNGGILTALNLFTTKFDQVLDLVEKRSESVEYDLFSFFISYIAGFANELPSTVISYWIHQDRLRSLPGQHQGL
jgi:hypothetical protein